MSINFDSALGIHADAVRLRSQRINLLATNLVNVDTPGFKARDIDFQRAMKMATTDQSSAISTTDPKHFANSSMPFDLANVQYRTVMQVSLDGNTVDEQIEQTQFMENAVQYQASLDFLGGKFKGLLTAIKGE